METTHYLVCNVAHPVLAPPHNEHKTSIPQTIHPQSKLVNTNEDLCTLKKLTGMGESRFSTPTVW